MTGFAIPAPLQPSVAIHGSAQRFPVRRIFCVGRNYAEHAREMGNDDRDPPFFFTKPADALIADGATIRYPLATADLHHEAELVVAIGTSGVNIAEADAGSHIWGYATGNDLTRRDLQAVAKAARRPWDMSKGFDHSAACGAITRAPGAFHRGQISCTVNGTLRQSADLADMIWPVPAIIAALSALVELQPGDLIYTGTPAGVGPLVRGDSCTVAITGLAPVTTTIG